MSAETVPLWVWLDSSSVCNLACRVCYTLPIQSHDVMSMDTFATVVEQLRRGPFDIVKFHLNWRGEPCANPRLADMLAHVDGCGWDIEWHTNGTLITERRARQLVAACRDQRIFVSLDGGDAASFEDNRGEGTWARALRGATALLDARGQAARPEIGIYQLDLDVQPEAYDPSFRRLIKRVDQHVVTRPVGIDGGSLQVRDPVPRGPCFWLGNALIVDARGHAHTCLLSTCTRLGSVHDHTVEELVGRASRLRAKVAAEGRRSVPKCASCRKQVGSAQRTLAQPNLADA